MTIILILVLLVGLLVLGFSTPVALGTAALTYVLALSSLQFDQALELLATRVFGVVSNDVLIGIALFVLYGRLCAEMNVRSRLASALSGLFGRSAGMATTAEVTTSLVQPDTAGDALLQRNDEAAATVNRLRLAGAPGWSAIGQSAALAFLRAITPPGVLLIILGDLFGVSIAQLFLGFAPFSILVGLLLLLMAVPAGAGRMPAVATPEIDAGSLSWIAVPFIVLGVIGFGYATPPEAGALAVALALIFGITQRQLSGQRLLRALLDSMQDTGAIFLVVVFAYCLAAALTLENAADVVVQWMSNLGAGPALFAAALAAFALSSIVGPLPTLFVLGTLVAPAMAKLGVEPMRIAMVFGTATSLGLLVPPLGPIFGTLAAGTRERLSRVVQGISYFGLAGLVVLGFALYGPIWNPFN
jgi:TRAP-type C4-dicarboxylate transport system permease large subunit